MGNLAGSLRHLLTNWAVAASVRPYFYDEDLPAWSRAWWDPSRGCGGAVLPQACGVSLPSPNDRAQRGGAVTAELGHPPPRPRPENPAGAPSSAWADGCIFVWLDGKAD